ARRRQRAGQFGAERLRRIINPDGQFLLEPHVAPLGAEIMAHQVGDAGRQDLPQPADELRFIDAPKDRKCRCASAKVSWTTSEASSLPCSRRPISTRARTRR